MQHDKKEQYIGFRITPKNFSTEDEAELFYTTQRNLNNKSDFNRDSVKFMTMIEATGNTEKFQKLMKIVDYKGLDAVISSLESSQNGVSEKEVERIVLSILEKRNESVTTMPAPTEKKEVKKKPNIQLKSRA